MNISRWLISLVRQRVDHHPRFAALYRNVRDQLSFNKEPITTPWGFKLAGNLSMAQGTFEPVETALVRKILKDIDVLVNVGANIGYYCCHALRMGKQVIAFEPIPLNLRYLCKNIKANSWSGVEIFPIALSNSVGILEMYGGDTGASILKGWADIPESYVTLVPVSTMDVVLGSRLSGKKVLVVVDVEGAEKRMLEGATNLLASEPKPIWMVEILSEEHQPTGVKINPDFNGTFQLFFRKGYKAYNIDQEIKPVTMEQVELVSKGSQRFKTHNFLFRE